MMKHFAAALLVSMLAPAVTSAETPYSPKKSSPSALIQHAVYDKVPIRMTQWNVTGTRQVVNGKRLDFEQSYDVPYWDMVQFFEDAYKNKQAVSVLDPDVFPHAKNPELKVYGTHSKGDVTFFSLGHPDLPYKFELQIRPDDQSKAVVVIQNAVYSNIYSGTMPARVGFKPAGKTAEIPFRWN